MLSATDILTWSVLAFQLIGALASPASSPSSNVRIVFDIMIMQADEVLEGREPC